ncbi:hypothetical protein ASPCAL07722 [Aspergillus calidoustus]|uniref:Uncharacterized protein n=1 Tax=Aspergillus calidoustus TaxID=454130 RepID=A0A0U5GPH0_ASPCI|nr:hypothetical protein ASPCAL07722 [Aspergillus calidoustus]
MDSRPNSGVPDSGSTKRKPSLLEPSPPDKCEPSTTQRSFMFVDTQNDLSQEFGVGREKMAFLSKLAHRRRKKESIQRLKATQRANNQQLATSEDLVMQGATRQGAWKLNGYLGQGYVDPFDTSSVAMTDSMNLYFHHFRVQVAPTAIPFDGAREGRVWAQVSASLPALRYIGLFLAAENKAVLECTHRVSLSASAKSSQEAIRFRVEAIKHLNNALQHPDTAVSESTLWCVSTMKHCEALSGQFTALQAHKKGLCALIDLAGGLEKLGHALVSTIYQGDIATAALNDSQPCFPMLPSFRRAVLDEAAMFSSSDGNYDYGQSIPRPLSGFGMRFIDAAWYRELNSDMRTTLHACRRLFVHFEMATKFPTLVKPTGKDLYIILLHHLLSLRFSHREHDLNDPLRRTLFAYTYLRIWNFGGFSVTRHILNGLKRSLISHLAYFQATAPDLLLWITFIGSMASQGYEHYSWFVGTLRDVAVHMNVMEWHEARTILVGFFYSDRTGYRTGENLWDEVMAPSPPHRV